MKANVGITVASERIYEVIRYPVVTEKSTSGIAENRYVFKVLPSATKGQIKMAVETLFKVKVEAVSTLHRVGKEKRFRGIKGWRDGHKRAVVRLSKGNAIDVGAKV